MPDISGYIRERVKHSAISYHYDYAAGPNQATPFTMHTTDIAVDCINARH